MANALYPLWKQSLMTELDANNSLDVGDIQPVNGVYVVLLTIAGGYVYSDAHQFYTDLTNVVGGVVPRITTPTVNGRVFSGDTVTFTNVTGDVVGAIALYRQNNGANNSWRLVLYEDTGVIGLPMLTNGGNVIVKWNAQGIFGL